MRKKLMLSSAMLLALCACNAAPSDGLGACFAIQARHSR